MCASTPSTAVNQGGVRPGDRVRIRFRLWPEAAQPPAFEELQLQLGEEQLLPVIEQAVLGAQVGQRLQLPLAPEQAYGAADPAARLTLPRSEFDSQWTLVPGSIVSFALPGADEVVGQVVELNEDWVEVDFNHPLAGQSLICELEILSIETER